MSLFIGTDIGGTKISVVIGDEQANVIASQRFLTASHPDPYDALREVARIARHLLSDAGFELGHVEGVGISCGGPLDSRQGLILSPPNLPGWDRIPICRFLSNELGRPSRLENDANAAALAEWRFGAGRGTSNMIFLTCSTGMGGGLIIDGRLYRGKQDLAGEVGHMRLTDDGPKAYDKKGSFEAWASGTGIAQQAGRPADEVGRDALAGDPEAMALVQHAGEMLGRGIAILCDVLNPEIVVCGTLAVKLGDLYLEPARKVLAREALAPCLIVPSALGAEFGNKAALAAALAD
jgi:glucokinase